MDLIIAYAATIAAIGTLLAALVSVYRIARRLDDAIGKDTSGRTMSDRLARVEHQLWENGGSSLADRVNRIETTAHETKTEIVLVKEILVAMVSGKK